ncbi:hypothetical protein BDB00DRAFT_818369 [Zychaea mexicana]|uniref:uncharacterized protein n=1 Tax=Zychaea mexicana TaxID=64656 RepID=UPI0022FF3327|nr:uncharacterized protein BDB00DRAFT_818369 [Zychaea mexicana]KAI9494518.1 hypothetical protein BDB00DRAFT_818369 [Zychaea mexicana]
MVETHSRAFLPKTALVLCRQVRLSQGSLFPVGPPLYGLRYCYQEARSRDLPTSHYNCIAAMPVGMSLSWFIQKQSTNRTVDVDHKWSTNTGYTIVKPYRRSISPLREENRLRAGIKL